MSAFGRVPTSRLDVAAQPCTRRRTAIRLRKRKRARYFRTRSVGFFARRYRRKVRRDNLTPARTIATGVIAAGVETLALDLLQVFRQRQNRTGSSFRSLETGESIEGWDDVSAPGEIGRRVMQGFVQRDLPSSMARSLNNVVHWSYGLGWCAAYGASTERIPYWPSSEAPRLACWCSRRTTPSFRQAASTSRSANMTQPHFGTTLDDVPNVVEVRRRSEFHRHATFAVSHDSVARAA